MAIDDLEFVDLVEIMAGFEQENEPSDVDRAMQRAAVERRLMALLSGGQRTDERRAHVRVPGELGARIYREQETIQATVRDLCEGGLRLTSAWGPPVGATLEVELRIKSIPGVAPPRAPVMVAWVVPLGDGAYEFGVRFLAHDDAHRRRMRRVVVELLRRVPLATQH
jgi:hypothetical protein